VIHDAVEGVGAKKVSDDVHVSLGMVYKWCRPDEGDGSGTRNPLDRVLALSESTGSSELVNWLCQRLGGYFVANPPAEAGPGDAMVFLQETQAMIERFSGLLTVLTESMNDDGRIDAEESQQIRAEWERMKGRIERLVVACESGVFDQPAGG
jgi:hypothetical protein